MPRTLTYQHLADKGACPTALAKFRALFGDAVEVTGELALRHASDFPWDWAADNLLSVPASAEYKLLSASAFDEYKRAMAPASAEYKRAMAAAFGEYDRIRDVAYRDVAYAEYACAMATARAEYECAMATARAECWRVRTAAWARLYIGE